MSGTYLIFGLGNPGEKYQRTRHNAGRIVAEMIWRKNANKKIKFVVPDEKIMMNGSGRALAGLVKTRKDASRLIVIHDDLDLPLGKFKISWNRGTGGHRGLDSIVRQIKTTEFSRIRIGIAPVTPGGKIKKPSGEAAVLKHILGEFKDQELKIIRNVGKKVAEAVQVIVGESLAKAMTLFN